MEGETTAVKPVGNLPAMRGAASGAGPLVLASIGSVCLLVLCAWVWWRRRERMANDPGGAAFDRLAAGMKLTRAERERVREMAAFVPGATPVALLVSSSAMSRAMAAAEGAERGTYA